MATLCIHLKRKLSPDFSFDDDLCFLGDLTNLNRNENLSCAKFASDYHSRNNAAFQDLTE